MIDKTPDLRLSENLLTLVGLIRAWPVLLVANLVVLFVTLQCKCSA